VQGERWFYRSDDEWNAFAERLKLIACPHCHVVGTLIRHGSLTGFDDANPPRKVLRARRVFCSNRHRRPGCGRTVSVWIAAKIRRLSLGTRTLWHFLRRVATGTLTDAIRDTHVPLSDRTLRRIGTRFDHAQSQIRTALCMRCPPPTGPPDSGPRPILAEVLAHLFAAFPDTDDPLAAYQQATGTFVIATRPKP
jgi:hypothetical protein